MPILQPTEKLASDMSLAWSIITATFNEPAQLGEIATEIANGLGVTKGYGELLVQLLVDLEYMRFEPQLVGVGKRMVHKVAFVESGRSRNDLDVDIFDLERIDVGAVAVRLADQLKLNAIEEGTYHSERATEKALKEQQRAVVVAEGMLERAKIAYERAKFNLKMTERSTKSDKEVRIKLIKDDLRAKRKRLRGLKDRLTAEKARLQQLEQF